MTLRPDKIEALRQAYLAGERAWPLSRRLHVSDETVRKHFRFAAQGLARGELKPMARTIRHYPFNIRFGMHWSPPLPDYDGPAWIGRSIAAPA